MTCHPPKKPKRYPDADKWMVCARTEGYPFKRLGDMTVDELQQVICHLLDERNAANRRDKTIRQLLDGPFDGD